MKDIWNKVSWWGAERVARAENPCNWPQNREWTETGDEVWRNRNESQADLCKICRTIDFRVFFQTRLEDNRDEVPIGYLDEVQTRTSCPFCRLVVKTVRAFTGYATLPSHIQGSRIKCDLRQVAAQCIRQTEEHGLELHRAIWLVTIPALPSILRNQSTLRPVMDRINCRPLDTPVPWAMKGQTNELIMRINYGFDVEDPNTTAPIQIVQDFVDYSRVAAWMKQCECSQPKSVASLPGRFRLIDVLRRCLVEDLPQVFQYVALSYTWGKLERPFLRNVKLISQDLAKDGSLSAKNTLLPKTIRDAMALVQGVGDRYLWVDSICIIQDDDADKSEQIGVMAGIYQCASWTLVAAAGDHSDVGLFGVPPTRRVCQHQELVQGLVLVNQFNMMRETVDVSPWNSRGWTYQERVLSGRTLFVSDCQFYLTCPHSTKSEQVSSEDGFTQAQKPDVALLNMTRNTSIRNYMDAVGVFSSRQLTYDSDTLNAFSGVCEFLRPALGGGFVLGLPQTYFDMALLWYCKSPVRRRIRQEGTSTLPFLPSWTWAAWCGEVRYDRTYNLSSRLLYQGFFDETTKPFNAEDLLPSASWAGWSKWTRARHDWTQSEPPGNIEFRQFHPILPEDERLRVQYASPSSGALQFWTQTVSLMLTDAPLLEEFSPDDGHDLKYSYGVWKAVEDIEGRNVGVVQLNVDSSDIDFKKAQPLILLSRTTRRREVIHSAKDYHFARPCKSSASKPWDQRQFGYDAESIIEKHSEEDNDPWNIYNVMLTDMVEGLSSRRGLGVVDLTAFHASAPRRVFITLV